MHYLMSIRCLTQIKQKSFKIAVFMERMSERTLEEIIEDLVKRIDELEKDMMKLKFEIASVKCNFEDQ